MVKAGQLLGVDFVPLPDRLDGGADAMAEPVVTVEAKGAGKQQRLDALRQRHDCECPHCTNATAHTQTVFGEGNPDARLVFVGEAPGAEEDKTGRPFVGRAGQLLDKMIVAMGLQREDVYIANVLKSRPPNNATPTPAEVMNCAPYLAEQLKIIAPEVIVALGAPSAKFLLDTTQGISALRGSWHACRFGDLEIPVMPTFHPAYLLRNYTPEARGKVWSDLQIVMKRLNENA
jgi:DNA polymerase